MSETASPVQPPILRVIPEQLVGERVLVRPLRSGDGQAIWEAVEETREQLRPWMPWVESTLSADDSETFARDSQARWLLREKLPAAIWDRKSGRYLGGTGFHGIDWGVPRFHIGYWLRLSAQGQGLMTEAVSLLCRCAFETLGSHRVEIHCDANNERSAAIPRRLGFVHEATLRNERRDHHGELRDELIFALTPLDYQTRLEKTSL
jgi:ribosomal-protein-serine acetyltransferase